MNDKRYIIPEWVYPTLKWLSMLWLPALSTLVLTLGNIWGWDAATPAAATITAVGAFIGACIGLSNATAKEA